MASSDHPQYGRNPYEVAILLYNKVENILKCSLDAIPSPSPSVKIQIMSRKVCLRCKGKTLLGVVNKLLKTISFASLPQVNFPSNNLNFQWSWRWWDWIRAIFLNIFYFKKNSTVLVQLSGISRNISYLILN